MNVQIIQKLGDWFGQFKRLSASEEGYIFGYYVIVNMVYHFI